MYTTAVKTESSADPKYTVADILSSMASGGGEPLPSPFSEANYMSGILTGTTPTLTPTTIASIEQTFIELQAAAPASSTTPTDDISRQQAGFVPPVVDPRALSIKSELREYYTDDAAKSSSSSDNSTWMPVPAKRSRPDPQSSVISYAQAGQSAAPATASTAPQRKTPGRRGKNEVLTAEEQMKRSLRRERNKLAAAKCRQRRVDHTNELMGETDELEEIRAKLESEVQQLQQQKEQLEFLLDAHRPMCSVAKLRIKPDPDDSAVSPAVKVEIATVAGASTATFSTQTSRPTSLPLPVQGIVTSASSISAAPVFGQLGLDSMADGHTGLTPITGAPTCASQVKRSSSDSSPSDGMASPTSLMAL